jgi:hypothetical protein
MESYSDPGAALAVAERAAAAPYVDYPPTPKWYPLAAGAWAALVVLVMSGAWSRPAVFIPLLVALIVAEGAFLVWYRRYRQIMPSMRHAPREINAAFGRYFVGLALVVGVCVGVYVTLGSLACAAVTLVVVTAGLALYERDYASAAAATRARLRHDA